MRVPYTIRDLSGDNNGTGVKGTIQEKLWEQIYHGEEVQYMIYQLSFFFFWPTMLCSMSAFFDSSIGNDSMTAWIMCLMKSSGIIFSPFILFGCGTYTYRTNRGYCWLQIFCEFFTDIGKNVFGMPNYGMKEGWPRKTERRS